MLRRSTLLAVLVMAACSPPAAPSAPVEPAGVGGGPGRPWAPSAASSEPPARGASDVLEDAAMALFASLEKCERRHATELTLSYPEITALSNKELDQKEYETEIADFIAARCREFAEPHPKLVGVSVVKQEHLLAAESGKLKRDVDLALVRLVTEDESGKRTERGIAFTFVKTDAGWKFSPKN